jgi:hypothetical protein
MTWYDIRTSVQWYKRFDYFQALTIATNDIASHRSNWAIIYNAKTQEVVKEFYTCQCVK